MKLITPDDHEHWLSLRSQDITSTESSALFGINPWMTEFELWHHKRAGEIVSLDENERMVWGRRLEPAIAQGIAEDRGWLVEPFKQYGRLEEIRAGSSFDFAILDPETKKPRALLEIKNVDSLHFRQSWVIDGSEILEAPPHIELQAQHQLMVTGYEEIFIGALIGGNTTAILNRKPQPNIINALRKKIALFWESIDKCHEPRPDFERDSGFISELYASSEPGTIMSASPYISELTRQYQETSEQINELEKKRKAFKAELLTLIGDAEKVISDDFTISCGTVGPAQISFERKAFRNFRVFKKKKE